MDNAAAEWVEEALRDSIPPSVPMPYKRVISARFIKRKRKTAVASLEMIDGLHGYIEVSTWMDVEGAWSYQWHEMEGGALYWNGEQWVRDVSNPEQMELDLFPAV